MENDKIKEGNIAIAEFMGAKCHKGIDNLKKETYAKFPDDVYSGVTINIKKLEYHSSWNELMPAIQKWDRITPSDVWAMQYVDLCEELDMAVTRNYEVRDAFEQLVKNIQWYNTQPQ